LTSAFGGKEKPVKYSSFVKYALCFMLASMATLTSGFTANDLNHVHILVDGQTIETHTAETNPESMLEHAGVHLNAKDDYYLENADNQVKITVYRALPVTIEYKGEQKEIMTTKETVQEALSDAGYNVNDYTAAPSMNSKIEENLVIKLDDSPAVKAAAEEEARRRAQQVETSRGMVRYTEAMTMEASAYLPTDGNGAGITASGMRAQHGVVAVDPDVIPLGTRLFIPGYGEAIAADTGGAIDGYMIDLCMESYGDAIQFGRRDITVYVLQ